MYYKIKVDKVSELKDGRTNKSIASKVGCSETHINQLFLGNKKCSETLAKLIILMCTNSTNNENTIQDSLKYFFKEVKD